MPGPIESRERQRAGVRIEHGRIRSVQPSKFTVDVELERGAYLESVPVACEYFHQETGEGIYALPEVGAHCLVLTRAAEGERPIILSFVPLRVINESAGSATASDDHSTGRGAANPGDLLMQGRDGNFVRVKRGGIVEIGANEGTTTYHYPIGNLIREVCANRETHVSGSAMKWQTLVDPEDDTFEGPSPIQLDFILQEFAEKPPIIDFKIGHIVDDEDRRLADGSPGDIVTRFLIYDQQTAINAEEAGIPPSPDQARVAIRFDKNGNAEEIYKGRLLTQARGRRLNLLDSDRQFVRGGRDVDITGSLDIRVGGDVTDRCRGNRVIETNGELVLSARTIRMEERLALDRIIEGNTKTTIGGTVKHRCDGDRVEATGGSKSDSVLGDSARTVGGKVVETVLRSAEPESTLQNAVAHLLTVLEGKIQRNALLGDIEFNVGPPTSPVCTVKIHNDPRVPSEVGRVSITWPNPRQELLIDGITGTVKISNTVGEWLLDSKGTTHIGIPESRGTAGNIVTTLTHPVCYVTGAPILGCANCTASGPPLPGPSTPAVPPIPNVNLPDQPLP